MKSRILGCLVTAVALALSSVATTGRAAAADRGDHDSRDGLVVMTVNGAIRGTSTGDVDSFLGIRYAAPPLGPPRWQPPQPAPRWSGVIQATSYGNRCAALASTNGPLSLAEDCLFLNVQRPAHTRPGERIPVYFFIHGGGTPMAARTSTTAPRSSTRAMSLSSPSTTDSACWDPSATRRSPPSRVSPGTTVSRISRRRCYGSTGTSQRSEATRGR